MTKRALSLAKRVRFIEALKACGSIEKAGAAVGVNKNVIRRARLESEHFDKQVIAAKEHAFSTTLEAEAFRRAVHRSEEHTSELQSLMRIPTAVFCWKKK